MIPKAWLNGDVFVAGTSDILPGNTTLLSSGGRSTVLPEKAVYLDCQHRGLRELGFRSGGKRRKDN